MSDIGQFAMFLAVGFAALGFFFGPIGRAAGRWIESRAPKQGDRERFQDFEARMSDLEASRERLAELEERLDFAERLLAQQREPERLPDGRS